MVSASQLCVISLSTLAELGSTVWKHTEFQPPCKAGPPLPLIAVQATVSVTSQDANFLRQELQKQNT